MKTNHPPNFIFVSLSGSGKETQIALLQKELKDTCPMRVISTGNLFRELAARDTDVGRHMRELLDTGGLPMDDIATALWIHEISFTLNEKEGLICDGFPRRVEEARSLDRFLKFLDRFEQTHVVYLNVSLEEVQRRLIKRGRADDTELAITGRITFFQEYVMPVIYYYREQNRLIEINGEQSVEQVHQDVIKALGL